MQCLLTCARAKSFRHLGYQTSQMASKDTAVTKQLLSQLGGQQGLHIYYKSKLGRVHPYLSLISFTSQTLSQYVPSSKFHF